MNKSTLSDWLERDPYSLAAKDKSVLLGEEIKKLTEWHYLLHQPLGRQLHH